MSAWLGVSNLGSSSPLMGRETGYLALMPMDHYIKYRIPIRPIYSEFILSL